MAGGPRPLLLLTNDDGIEAPGLASLAEAVAEHGDVVVIAPSAQASGSSQRLDFFRDVSVVELEPRGPGQWFAVDGSPATCVLFGLRGLCRRDPALVIAGINDGQNVGSDTRLSGTVGAARMAADLGGVGLAVSVAKQSPALAEAARRTGVLVASLLADLKRVPAVLNVNFPGGPAASWSGARVAPLGGSAYRFETETTEAGYRIRYGPGSADSPPESDASLLAAGHVTVSAIEGSDAALESFIQGL